VTLELLDGGGQAPVALALLAVGLGVLQRVSLSRSALRGARPQALTSPVIDVL